MHAILYRSQARAGTTVLDLNQIVATSKARNRALDITGILLYGTIPAIPGAPGQFVQWIEGPETSVARLAATIRADRRHVDFEVLARGPVDELVSASAIRTPGQRLFPIWSLGLVRLSALPATASGFLSFAREWDGATLPAAA